MTFAGRLRQRRCAGAITRRRSAYPPAISDADRVAVQLAPPNSEWARVVATVPLCRRAVEAGELPGRFDSLEAFVRQVPVTSRGDVRGSLDERTSSGRKPDFQRTTGGSTAQPVQVPAWSSEQVFTRDDRWLGRSWYGITPASRLFLLRGHSHLLGTGFGGWMRARRMEVSDLRLGYHRQSAYDMRSQSLRQAARALLGFRPDYVVGSSVALDRATKGSVRLRLCHRQRGPRRVEVARRQGGGRRAGVVPGSRRARVAMEYGAVETGLVAHTEPAGGYRVLWRSYLLDAKRHRNGWRLPVTGLFPRWLPLVRYDIGDEVDLPPRPGDTAVGLTRFERVAGRCNGYVAIEDGTVVHSEAFTHVVRVCREVYAYQIVQRGSSLRIDYVAPAPLSEEAEAGIRGRLARIHPRLERIRLAQVADLKRTISGKTRMVMVE